MREYRYIADIGAGPISTIAKAERNGSVFALKILHPFLAQDEIIAERFRRAYAIAGKLTHPHLASIHDLIEWNDSLALVMDYFPQGNLDSWRTSDTDELAAIASQIAAGLSAVHSRGIIHRNLKNQNIFFKSGSQIVISDFTSAHIQNLSGLTTSSMFLGNPDHVAPETAFGIPPDPRTDLYSLGVILYRAATGVVPSSDAADPRDFSPELSDWLANLILRLVGPIEERPPDTTTFLEIIKQKRYIKPAEMKPCLICGASIPADAEICFACGTIEPVVREASGLAGCCLVLSKLGEDADLLERFMNILRSLSGDPSLDAAFLTGDWRLYSREERKAGIRLPVRIADHVLIEDAQSLHTIFSKMGIKTRIALYSQRRRYKRGPLIQIQTPKKRNQTGLDLLTSVVDFLELMKENDLRRFFCDLAMSSYKASECLSESPLYEHLVSRLETLREMLPRTAADIIQVRSYMRSVELGSLYAEMKRAELRIHVSENPAEIDEFIMQKQNILQNIEKYHAVQTQYAVTMGMLLRLKNVIDNTASRLTVSEDTTELDHILKDLEQDLKSRRA